MYCEHCGEKDGREQGEKIRQDKAHRLIFPVCQVTIDEVGCFCHQCREYAPNLQKYYHYRTGESIHGLYCEHCGGKHGEAALVYLWRMGLEWFYDIVERDVVFSVKSTQYGWLCQECLEHATNYQQVYNHRTGEKK